MYWKSFVLPVQWFHYIHFYSENSGNNKQIGSVPGMLAELDPERMLEVDKEDQSYAASVLFMASW